MPPEIDGEIGCMIIESSTDTEVFHVYMSDVLLPSLREGDLVVMDNRNGSANPSVAAKCPDQLGRGS